MHFTDNFALTIYELVEVIDGSVDSNEGERERERRKGELKNLSRLLEILFKFAELLNC